MKRVTAVAAVLVAAVLVAFTMSARAQDLNPLEKTYLTFSGPVELPGVTLPAGTYTFKLADTPGRNVVQVLSQDEKDIHGQFLFVQAKRPDASGETVVTFRETAEGATPAVQYWYYPGETIGKEFVYPKDQAMRIAARTKSTVLSVDGEIGPEASVSSIDASGKVTPWERETSNSASQPQAQAQVETPAPSPAASAQPTAAAGSLAGNRGAETEPQDRPTAAATVSGDAAVGTSGRADAGIAAEAQTTQPTPRAQTQSDAQPERQFAGSELPRTASPLPISGLLGLLSLAGGLGVRAMRR